MTDLAVHRKSRQHLLTLAELRLGPVALLEHLVAVKNPVDAFLLAAALRQVVEDVLEADPWRLGAAQRVFGGRARRVARTVATTSAALRRPSGRAVRAFDTQLAPIVDELADAVVAGALPAQWAPRVRSLACALPADRALQRAVTRPPTAFRDFDQHPEDIRELVDRLLATIPPGPLVVVGVRTSGSYLAPLTAAHLRAAGRPDASALSMRPFVPLTQAKRRVLRSAGTIIVTDDAPASGGSLLEVAEAIQRLGIPGAAIRLMLQLLDGDDDVPPPLRRYSSVLLEWPEWSIHTRLTPAAIKEALEQLWPARAIESVTVAGAVTGLPRGHCGRRYRVICAGGVEHVEASGTGLGYLGRSSLAVQAALNEYVVPTHGIVDGVAFRPWSSDARRPDLNDDALAGGIASYAAQREARLAVATDATALLAGQDPVWEVASNQLAQAFGRGWRAARLLAVDRVAEECLRALRPAVIDGRMSQDCWSVVDGSLVKAGAAERAFCNRNLAHVDVAYDVASGAVAWPQLATRLRREFGELSGAAIDAERWLILRLVALWAAERDAELSGHAARRAGSRALQEYIAEVYLDDLEAPGSGPLCAIDLDGVLETETLGFLGTSPAGGRSLRALRAHGFRPILVSGRSATEVAERCHAYGLVGGVAEYGAVTCGTRGEDVRSVPSPAETATLDRVREDLRAVGGVEVSSDYRCIVRAWSRDDRGRRRPVPETALTGWPGVRIVHGDDQTDVVPAGVDKGTGLHALLARMGEPPRIALAIGDTAEDLPMLACAELAMAPANAAASLRDGAVRITRRHYQAGVAEAVETLIGHEPGGCVVCAADERGRHRRRLLRILSARERGSAGMALVLARLILDVRRP